MHDRNQREQKEKLDIEDVILDPYEVLRLERTADAGDIKKAYFALVREFPPEQAPEQFKRVRAAYDMLRTPEAKAVTDLFLLHPPPPYIPPKRQPVFILDYQAADKQHAAYGQTDLVQTDFRASFRDIKL
jgi:curved DNA-binding protein CbpA